MGAGGSVHRGSIGQNITDSAKDINSNKPLEGGYLRVHLEHVVDRFMNERINELVAHELSRQNSDDHPTILSRESSEQSQLTSRSRPSRPPSFLITSSAGTLVKPPIIRESSSSTHLSSATNITNLSNISLLSKHSHISAISAISLRVLALRNKSKRDNNSLYVKKQSDTQLGPPPSSSMGYQSSVQLAGMGIINRTNTFLSLGESLLVSPRSEYTHSQDSIGNNERISGNTQGLGGGIGFKRPPPLKLGIQDDADWIQVCE